MAKPQQIEDALARVNDQSSFIQELLQGALGWPVPDNTESLDDISYDWSESDLRTQGLSKKLVAGTVKQILLQDNQAWGIFVLEFKHPDVFTQNRGLTGPLRSVLRGLVASRRRNAKLAAFRRENLLFICTHQYQYYRFAYFKAATEDTKTSPLSTFGWGPDSPARTACEFNLPELVWPATVAPAQWVQLWAAAFDVEKVTKHFFIKFNERRDEFTKVITGIPSEHDRRWYASVLLNRIMFIYFLQRKLLLDKGDGHYLENKLAESKANGPDRYYLDFLRPLFFEGFAKPPEKRSAAAGKILGDIRYLNGGLFLPHAIEQRCTDIGVPDSAFENLLRLFSDYSWNLDDSPDGNDSEINPDVLGYIFEQYINQKSFGAYYTRREITDYLCRRTVGELILRDINTPADARNITARPLPIRAFDSLDQLLTRLDAPLCRRLIDHVLPNLRLLDPACGSGAFLVAAMKQLIVVYAAIVGRIKFLGNLELSQWLAKTEKDHPSIDYWIKKRIITDNLFGVDIMEEATEIARLRLFLALVASAKNTKDLEPLPNIDFNIMAGNSLVGLLVVDAAEFDRRKPQGDLFLKPYSQLVQEKEALIKSYKELSEPMRDLAALRNDIERRKRSVTDGLDDIFLAEWQRLGIKFQTVRWDTAASKPRKATKRGVRLEDIKQLKPFHWGYEFDRVMAHGGFDAILTNPPWEVFKPNSKEFFLEYSTLVTRKKMRIEDFEAEQKTILARDKELLAEWESYLSSFPHVSEWYRSAPQFANQISVVNGKKAGTDINFYKLFMEQCVNLLRPGGQMGIVIPSGIYTDLGSKQLREMLFQTCQVSGLFVFENRRKIFDNVDSRFKFAVLTLEKGGSTKTFPAAFMRHDPAELDRFPANGAIPIDVELVRRLSPDSLSIMEFKSDMDVRIAEKMLKFPLLGEHIEGVWNVKLSCEFHMTNDSDLFETSPGKGKLPLYEGKMIWQFEHQYAEPRYWVDEKKGRARILGRTPETGQKLDYQDYRLGFRDIAANTNERTTISAIIPPTFHGNKIPTVCTRKDGRQVIRGSEQLWVCSFLNSFVLDAMVRMRVTTTLNFFYVYQLPVPRLTEKNPEFVPIVQRAARLICTTPEFDALAKSVGLTGHADGATALPERIKLRAELDGLIAHLYGLTEHEFAHILNTFPLVPDPARVAAHNAYRDVERGLIT